MSFILTTFFLLASLTAVAQYAPAGDKIKTQWAEEVNPQKVLPEYPRPLMERPVWKNLNGLWNYSITEKDARQPSEFQGEILVLFASNPLCREFNRPLGPTGVVV
jgi:hypothetical protein